eukprot:2480681-Amphidinium_carterae.1
MGNDPTGIPQHIPTLSTPRAPVQIGRTPSQQQQKEEMQRDMHVDQTGVTAEQRERQRVEEMLARSAQVREEQRRHAQSQAALQQALRELRESASAATLPLTPTPQRGNLLPRGRSSEELQ